MRWEGEEGFSLRRGGGDGRGVGDCVVVVDVGFVLWVGEVPVE